MLVKSIPKTAHFSLPITLLLQKPISRPIKSYEHKFILVAGP